MIPGPAMRGNAMQRFLTVLTVFCAMTAGAFQLHMRDMTNGALPADARWRAGGWGTDWLESGATNNLPAGVVADYTFYFQGKNVAWPVSVVTNFNPSETPKTFQFSTYTNTLAVIISGVPIDSLVPWCFSAYPDALTNSTAYQQAYTNSHTIYEVSTNTLAYLPDGIYKIAPGVVRGYETPASVTTNIASDAVNTVAINYVAYSNTIAVTVYGYPAGNCEWTITGPDMFTNATGYAATFTNNASISGVPHGSYTFNFPGVVGYTTPTNTLTITGDPLTNSVEATYVLAYPTNIPSGGGIQKFYQPSYFFTNVYLHDSGVPLHLRIAALSTNTIWGDITGTLSDQADLQEALDGKASTGDVATLTGRVGDVEGRTSVWDQAATDATGATGDVAAISTSFAAHTNNESADIQHLTAAEKLLATNSVQIGADGTSTNLSDYNNDAGFITAVGYGITDSTAYRGDWGHDISGRVDIAEGAISTNAANIATNAAALAALNSNLSFQAFSTWMKDEDGTATVTYAAGSLVALVVTNELGVTIAFDNADYPTNGVNRVGLEIWASTNSVAFDAATITNATAPTIYTNRWTSLFFRRVTTNIWYGRQ